MIAAALLVATASIGCPGDGGDDTEAMKLVIDTLAPDLCEQVDAAIDSGLLTPQSVVNAGVLSFAVTFNPSPEVVDYMRVTLTICAFGLTEN